MALGIGAAVYTAYFSTHGLPGASVAGVSVTGQTKSQLAAELGERADQVSVTLQIDDHSRELSLADLGISVDAQATADQVFAANENLGQRYSAVFTKQTSPVVATVDESKIDALTAELVSEYGDPAKDAIVKLGDDNASFIIEPAQAGTGVDASDLTAAADRAVQTLSSQTVRLTTSQVDPHTSTDQAQTVADKANKLVALDVNLTGRESDSYPATATQKAQWITIPTAENGSLGEPVISQEKVAAWVQQTADTAGVEVVNGIRNVNQAGTVVSTLQEARDGWQVNNATQLADNLVNALGSGQPYAGSFSFDKVDPTYQDKVIADGAQNLSYAAAPGERWLDVNLGNNTVTAYEGATVARGPIYVVPGMPGLETPTGKFNVYLKYQSQTMRGTNLDGTTYVAENIPWVTYFTGSIAFHGAPWRDSFGWSGPGGSHGCLNMPVADAQFIYGWAPMGAVVVSHY